MSSRYSVVPASYLILRRSNEVLLLRRFQTGYKDGNYSLPAGHVEEGETFTQTLIREVKEEIDITLSAQHVHFSHIMQRESLVPERHGRIDVFFTAEQWSGEPINNEPHKCDDLRWFPLDQLPKNIIPYIREALEKSAQKTPYSEVGYKKASTHVKRDAET
jgi:8-oxo-dGTP diphosphatase